MRSAAGGDPEDGSLERDGVDAAARVLAEGDEVRHPQPGDPLGARTPGPQPGGLDAPAADVAEDVAAVEGRHRAVADHHAAGDGAVAPAVEALDDRPHVAGRRLARRIPAAALERAPAEVLAAAAAHEVDLLDLVLADVADRQVAVAAVEREAPGVAQAVGVDLAAGARAPAERVPARDRVRTAPGLPRVDPEDLPEQRAEVLRVAPRAVPVAAAAAVAGADIEVPAGAEQQQPAVVVGLVVGHLEDQPGRAGVGPVGARTPVLDDALIAVGVRVVDVEQPAGGVLRGERHRQQALLPARGHPRGDVEERRVALAPLADDHDPAALLDDELNAPVARRGGDEDGLLEAPDADEPDASGGGARRRGRGLGGRGRGGGGGSSRRAAARTAAAEDERGRE